MNETELLFQKTVWLQNEKCTCIFIAVLRASAWPGQALTASRAGSGMSRKKLRQPGVEPWEWGTEGTVTTADMAEQGGWEGYPSKIVILFS
jgi:hypothetical protein